MKNKYGQVTLWLWDFYQGLDQDIYQTLISDWFDDTQISGAFGRLEKTIVRFKFTKADKHEPNRRDSIKNRNNKTRTNEFMKLYFLVKGIIHLITVIKWVYTKIAVKERPLSDLKGFFYYSISFFSDFRTLFKTSSTWFLALCLLLWDEFAPRIRNVGPSAFYRC